MAKNPLKRINEALSANGIIIIVVSALLLIAIYIIQYKFTEDEINEDVRLRAFSELTAKSLTIQNIMNEVETAVRNHTDDIHRYLNYPDSMFGVAKNLVELNSTITGSAISFVENFYPEKGKWFEAYAVRDSLGKIETMQLGSATHDYFKSEFYKNPLSTCKGGWTNPYLDRDGAKMMLTTYSEPIFNEEGQMIAVLDADISLDWLDDVLTVEYAYPSSYHVLLSKTGQLMSVADKNYLLKTIPEMGEDYRNNSFISLNDGMLSGESGETIITDRNGNKYLSYYMPVDTDTGWSLAIISSEKEVFADFHKMRVTILWLSISGFVILVLLMGRAILNIKKLEKVTTERERIKSELQIASAIQSGMLPKSDNLSKLSEGIQVAASLEPAKEVGGDLYDYFIKDKYLYFCIGDVSGKGVPASLFMAVARSLFRALAINTRDPLKIISGMNDTLVEFNKRDMFVTLFLGVLDLNNGRLDYCNAGHDSPVILNRKGIDLLNVVPNLPLGIFQDFEFQSQSFFLENNSTLFLYTDGVTEAMNSNKEEFGEKRMIDDLKTIYNNLSDITPSELINNLELKIKEFVGKAAQSDDLTIMSIKFNRFQNEDRTELILENDISEISRLNAFIDEVGRTHHLAPDFINELKLAIEEIVVNCISYSYEDNQKGNIKIKFYFKPDKVEIEIIDDGKEFDPTLPQSIDLDSSVEERQIGGLGLFLVKQLTDSMIYKRINNFNVLYLLKQIK